jgi:hypothetical protein
MVTCEIRFLCKRHFSGNIESKKLANSQPGDETSVFLNIVHSSLGTAITIGGCLHDILRNKNSLKHQVSNAHYIIKF